MDDLTQAKTFWSGPITKFKILIKKAFNLNKMGYFPWAKKYSYFKFKRKMQRVFPWDWPAMEANRIIKDVTTSGLFLAKRDLIFISFATDNHLNPFD